MGGPRSRNNVWTGSIPASISGQAANKQGPSSSLEQEVAALKKLLTEHQIQVPSSPVEDSGQSLGELKKLKEGFVKHKLQVPQDLEDKIKEAEEAAVQVDSGDLKAVLGKLTAAENTYKQSLLHLQKTKKTYDTAQEKALSAQARVEELSELKDKLLKEEQKKASTKQNEAVPTTTPTMPTIPEHVSEQARTDLQNQFEAIKKAYEEGIQQMLAKVPPAPTPPTPPLPGPSAGLAPAEPATEGVLMAIDSGQGQKRSAEAALEGGGGDASMESKDTNGAKEAKQTDPQHQVKLDKLQSDMAKLAADQASAAK